MENNENVIQKILDNNEEGRKIHKELDKFTSFDDIKNNKEEFKRLTELDIERMERGSKLRKELFSSINKNKEKK